MNQSLIKHGARKRFKIYGLCASLGLLAFGFYWGDVVVSAIAGLSLGIHIVSKY